MTATKSFNIQSKMFEVLKAEPEIRMTARDIAQRMLSRYPEDCDAKKSRARVDFIDYSFEDQLSAELGSVWKKVVSAHAQLKTIEKRPREYFYSTLSDEDEVASAVPVETNQQTVKQLTEHDLYPLLGQYLSVELNCLSMRIDELRSRNTRGHRGNMWLFPDIVGMTRLTENWTDETVDLAKAVGAERANLFSFEVKKKLNRSNVRESFYQTLSNSAWAHFAYLVAAEIDTNAIPELRLLCSAHNVGLINLNNEQPSESIVEIPAVKRIDIDWDLLNRLADENKDAKRFVKLVRDFHLTGETNKKLWDLTL